MFPLFNFEKQRLRLFDSDSASSCIKFTSVKKQVFGLMCTACVLPTATFCTHTIVVPHLFQTVCNTSTIAPMIWEKFRTPFFRLWCFFGLNKLVARFTVKQNNHNPFIFCSRQIMLAKKRVQPLTVRLKKHLTVPKKPQKHDRQNSIHCFTATD